VAQTFGLGAWDHREGRKTNKEESTWRQQEEHSIMSIKACVCWWVTFYRLRYFLFSFWDQPVKPCMRKHVVRTRMVLSYNWQAAHVEGSGQR
jgi:hypothetical protein